MPMMFFHFLKIIFDISTSKRSKKYKPHSILAKKKKIQNLMKRSYKRNAKQTLKNDNNCYIITSQIQVPQFGILVTSEFLQ
jgi:hypothetical protein